MNETLAKISDAELIEVIQKGDSLKSIASTFGISIHKLRKELGKRELDVNELRPTLTSRIKSLVPQWVADGTRLVDAAKQLDISTSHLSGSLKRLGLSLNKTSAPKVPSHIKRMATLVVEGLIIQGGSVTEVCRSLGYEHDIESIRAEIKRRGIDPLDFFYANRRYGNWLVLPSTPVVTSSGDKRLKARCLLCGTEHEVLYGNLVSGRSKSCNDCRRSTPISVVDVDTGEIFSSIRSAVASLDALDYYQSIRQRLNNHSECSVNGHTLKVRNEETVS